MDERKELAERLHRTGESLLGQLEEELGVMDEELASANAAVAAKESALAEAKEANSQLVTRLQNGRTTLLRLAGSLQAGV